LEAEQHIAQWPMSHQWNQRGNSKVPGSYSKWKHDLPESMGHSKGGPKRKVYSHDCLY
jgi:hypothetical protein